MRRWLAAVTALVLLGASIAGCSSKSADQSQPAGGGTGKEIKLVFWDTNNAGVLQDVVETLSREFEQKNPGVKIEHKGWTTEELQKTLQRAVSTGEGPDIAQINNGEINMGPMVRAKLLVSLDQYDKQFGWSKRVSAGLLARGKYSEDGKTFGSGTLFGVPMTGEIVGFFYNKKIFADNGIKVPQTFAELESAMAALRSKNVDPLIFGNLDKWPAIHLFGEIDGVNSSREYLDGLIFHQGNKSWDTDEMKQAAAKLQEWVKKGYLMKDFAGVGSDDAWKLFANGKGAMLLQGSWLSGDLAQAMGDNVGFFLMPGNNGKPVFHVGGAGIPYGIIKGTKNEEMAAKFIDYLTSDRAVELLLEKSNLPVVQIPEKYIKSGTLAGDLYAAWNQANKNDAMGHYFDWATPTFYDTLTANLQSLLAGQMDPNTFASGLQKDYGQFLSSQK